jgi:Ankyrin repeats (3 copies)
MITNYKLFENIEKAKKILKEADIQLNNIDYLKIKELLKDNIGYIGQFVKWFFKDNESFNKLEEIYKILKTNKIDKPIDSFDKLEDLFDYIQSFDINQKVNQVINSLPSKTRELVNQQLKDLISLNISYYKQIINFYSKKGGRYKNIKNLYDDTKQLIENLNGVFNLEETKKKLEGTNTKIVFESEDLLIVQVFDYNSSCKIESKHWCISTSENMWKQYVDKFTNQYFIYDFTKDISDKASMIGVTVNPLDSIKTAHYSDDTKIDDYSVLSDYKQYLKGKTLDDIKNLNMKPQELFNNWASNNGHLEIVKELLKDKRVDPSDDNNYAIRWASENGHLEVVKELLKDKRVDPSANNNEAIRWASQYGHLEVVKELLKDKRVIDKLTPSLKEKIKNQL